MAIMPISKSIKPRMAVLGLSSGILLVLAVLVGVALLAPRSAGAAVVEGQIGCPLAEISLDQGYGVTRTALRAVCPAESAYRSAENTAAR